MTLDVAQHERDHRRGMWERLHRRPLPSTLCSADLFRPSYNHHRNRKDQRGRVRRFSACKCVVEVMR